MRVTEKYDEDLDNPCSIYRHDLFDIDADCTLVQYRNPSLFLLMCDIV